VNRYESKCKRVLDLSVLPRNTVRMDELRIRHATLADEATLLRLAQLDSQPVPSLPALVAECDGVPVAALDVEADRVAADPFEPTAAVVAALRACAKRRTVRRTPAVLMPARGAA
jgi:hypothetical protein